MSSNAPSLPLSKGTNTPVQLPSPSQSQAPSAFPGADRQRRSGSSFGAASSSRAAISAPRNNQSLRKQNKGSRRPKLGYEDMSEAAAIRSASSRKGQTSITHLMNFSLPPRPLNHNTHSYGGRASSRRPYNWGYNAADKARYIHANYRFIVHPKGDYQHLRSVDDHMDWKDVLQVLASSKSQAASCPICLSNPVAPRMAKCGHIFCLPCLIRYMHSTDDSHPFPDKKARWKSCPICWDSIYMHEARPVRWFLGQEGEPPREGSDVVLRLMKRDAESNLALPKESADSTSMKEKIPWYFAAEVMDYAQVMRGSDDYMQSQFNREINDLEAQEKEDELMFGEETQWTQKAINAVTDAKERIRGIGNPPTRIPTRSEEKRPVRNPIVFSEEKDAPEFYRVTQAAKSGQSLGFGSSNDEARIASTETNTDQQVNSTSNFIGPGIPSVVSRMSLGLHNTTVTTFYFYQALLHYYLAPLDIRILKAAFGDYSVFPSSILPRVERVSTGHVVDDDLRKRAKYLAHLPYGCEVGFLECDWTDIVPPSILQNFSLELERRRKRNREKEMREEKERIRAEKVEEDKKWAAIRRRRPSIPDEAGAAPTESGSAISYGESLPVDIATAASPPWTRKRAGFTSLASPSTSPSAPRTVWGTTAIAPSESPQLQATLVPEPQENDGWLQGWEEDLLREEDHLVTQVQQASLREAASAPTSQKKKKNKKITLMSTNGRRAA